MEPLHEAMLWDYEATVSYYTWHYRWPRINTHAALDGRQQIETADHDGHIWQPIKPYHWKCRECGKHLPNVKNVGIGGSERDCKGKPVR